jgi:hypothetical protein
MGLACVAIVVAVWPRGHRPRRDPIVDDLIAANRAKYRPGMDRVDWSRVR